MLLIIGSSWPLQRLRGTSQHLLPATTTQFNQGFGQPVLKTTDTESGRETCAWQAVGARLHDGVRLDAVDKHLSIE